MVRFAAYAGASTALAVGVVLHAFNQRPNFYSATVYLAQSQACRIVLLNLVLLSTYTILRALQKALYGPLRAIEREQLWDKSWYAITETALAMTTFRDEVGVYFLVMFGTLLAGKIWAWISESRVDMLEQQPPANPKLFHARMLASLFISELFDILMLNYCVNTLINQPRPGMMVMYAFEYAVLFITSSSITLRYVLSLNEIVVMKKQTQAKLEERREEVRAARQDAERLAAEGTQEMPTNLEREEDIDENDIDVPGWEQKGKYILFLDLVTDFMKLVVYMFFFAMLLLFHGIPIHIIRDVYLTTRSFFKRITDFQKYRNATKDMNARYPDATAQELERDGTCIICREDMRPWEPPAEQPVAADGAQRPARPARSPPDERQRPKKLPCGHVLHLGCLKSWLERQQVCPTCRTSVLAPSPSRGTQGQNQAGAGQGNGVQGGPGANNAGAPGQQAQNQQGRNGHPNVLARQLRLGNWRFTFAAGPPQDVRQVLDNNRPGAGAPQQPQVNRGTNGPHTQPQPQLPGVDQLLRRDPTNIDQQLQNTQQQITQEIQRLQLSQQQLDNVRRLQMEFSRLRLEQSTARLRDQHATGPPPTMPVAHQPPQHGAPPRTFAQPYPHPFGGQPGPQILQAPGGYLVPLPQMPFQIPNQPSVYSSPPQQQNLAPGDANLPAGLTLPEGWNMMPLERAVPGRQAGAQPSGIDALDLPDLGLPQVLQQTTERAAVYAQSTQSTQPTRSPVNGALVEPQSSTVNGSATGTGEGAQQVRPANGTINLPSWGDSNASMQPPAVDKEQPTQTNGETQRLSTASGQDLDGMTELNVASTSAKGKRRAPRVEDTDEGDPVRSSEVADIPPDDVD